MRVDDDYTFQCPYCWQPTTLQVQLVGMGHQEYVEDCQVCCNPIEISFDIRDGEVTDFQAFPANSIKS